MQSEQPATGRTSRFPGAGAGWWILLAAVLGVEACLVVAKIRRDILPGYPVACDQTGYLQESYELYGRMRAHGFWRELGGSLVRESPTGILLVPAGAVAQLVLGPGRLACLSVNLMAFVAMQAALAVLWRRKAGCAGAGTLAVGLALACGYSTFWAGGLFDFRHDFAAACLFAVAVSAIVTTGCFARRRPSVAAGLLAGCLILLRILTAAYLAGILAVLACWLALLSLRGPRSRPDRAADLRRRGVNLLAAAAAALLLGAPIVVRNAAALVRYYGIGHLTGPEKVIRAAEAGIHSRLDFLTFYERSLVHDHLSRAGAWLLVIAALAGAAARLRRHAPDPEPASPAEPPLRLELPCALIALAVPYAILTSDESKSPVVASILVGPCLALALLLALPAFRLWGHTRVLRLLAGAALLCGGALFAARLQRPSASALDPARFQAVNRMDDEILRLAAERGLKHPRLAFAATDDAFLANNVNIRAFETTGTLGGCTQAFGGTIVAVTPEEVRTALGDADLVILPAHPPAAGSPLPFNGSLRACWPEIESVCAAEFGEGAGIPFPGGTVRLYVRRPSNPGVAPRL